VGYFQTPWHIVLLLLIALLLFGGKRLPEIGKSLGHGMREFKDAVTGNSEPEPDSEPQPELPPAEPAAVATTATPTESERETV
jgi:sec-independent protein translocase protein TatA